MFKVSNRIIVSVFGCEFEDGEVKCNDDRRASTPILCVANNAEDTVTFFNASTGAYQFTDIAGSSFTTGAGPISATVKY